MPGDKRPQERTAVRGLLTAAAACVTLRAAGSNEALIVLAVGLIISALVLHMRTADTARPYAYWPAWAAGTATALLLAWALPESRILLLPWAGFEAVVGLVLGLLWHAHRDGRRDWIVWTLADGALRREATRRAASAWVQDVYREPCVLSRVDMRPELVRSVPLYPYPGRPMLRVSRTATEEDTAR
ncbi:hypothetical protein [Streptomyces nanshensis]|uniref:Uncharacterized protein n=1 Tax=Streptomyces nanshensis TaxID=518642 RepID=A0A1E7KZ86_9ACTN|nr:hypothetical protein [Streptomyces nanshensis]OEV09246.1 hypothetical protein AN218_22535 [Streptomyces nanshensis]